MAALPPAPAAAPAAVPRVLPALLRPHCAAPPGRPHHRALATAAVVAGLRLSSASRRTARCAAEAQPRAAGLGDGVLVRYKVHLEDGTLVDSTEGGDPLSFILGKGEVMRGLETAVRGLSVGDKCSMTLTPDQAYGERDERLVFDLPAAQLPGGIKEGLTLNLKSGGRDVRARVVSVDEANVKLDANHVLAGETLALEAELVGFRQLTAPSEPPPGLALATFAAGCFWGLELAFQRLDGVVDTCVGYTQGLTGAPTYKEVCSGKTLHAESVRVVFDPSVVAYEELLQTFWDRLGESATTLNEAGNDKGTQYRSGIYCHSPEQMHLAEKSALELQMKLGKAVVTEVLQSSTPFWLAEEYHQRYLERRGQSAAKGCKEPIKCHG